LRRYALFGLGMERDARFSRRQRNAIDFVSKAGPHRDINLDHAAYRQKGSPYGNRPNVHLPGKTPTEASVQMPGASQAPPMRTISSFAMA
jgi:hypothetical protein